MKDNSSRSRILSRVSATLRTAHGLFAVTALAFGLFFVFTVPLLWGSDETSHTGRVYQITHGQIFSGKVYDQGSYSHEGYGGIIPSNLRTVVDYVNIDFNAHNHQVIPGVKQVDVPEDYQKFSRLALAGSQNQYNFSNTAIYSPVSYVPTIIGLGLAQLLGLHIGPTIFMTRTFDLIFYVAAITYLLYVLREFRFKWLIFSIALLPSVIFQAATINADTVTNVLAFLLVGLVMKSLATKSRLGRFETVALITSALCLPIVKPTYIFISLLGLAVPARCLALPRYRKLAMPLAIALGVVIYGLWQYKTHYLGNAVKYIIAGVVPWWQDIDSGRQLAYVLGHPLSFVQAAGRTLILNDNLFFAGLFGRLGFNFVPVPALAIVASLAAGILSILSAETLPRTRRNIVLIAGVLLLSIAAVFGTCYLTISAVGMPTIEGVQGRYFLPVVPVFALLLLYGMRLRLDIRKAAEHMSVIKLIVGLVIVSLLLSAIKYYYVTWG